MKVLVYGLLSEDHYNDHGFCFLLYVIFLSSGHRNDYGHLVDSLL